MSSPVKGNFGHIREAGVLLLTKEDSKEKHRRNGILTGYSFLALFTLGIGSEPIAVHAKLEKQIRHINIDYYPNLPYAMCVQLRDCESLVYNGLMYKNPHHKEDMSELKQRIYEERHPEEVQAWRDKCNREIEANRGGSFWV